MNYTRKVRLKGGGKIPGFIVFVAPAFILIFTMTILPFLMNIYYSLTSWNGLHRPTYIGLNNFREIFTDDPYIITAAVFTFRYTIYTVIGTNIAALFLAVILDTKIKTKNVVRTLFYMPHVISSLIAAFIFGFVFTRGFDGLLKATGLVFFNWSWLGDSTLAVYSVSMVSVWKSVGFYMVIYTAGLQTVPMDIIESAAIDGANSLQKFFRITLPMLMPSITICLFMSLSGALNVFDIPYALTRGGPGYATTGMPLNIYKEAFEYSRFGYASAKALIYFLVVTTLTFIQVKSTKKKEVEV